MIGLEMIEDGLGPLMSMGLAHNGVIAVFANHRPSTVQIMPPLVIQEAEVDFVLDALDKTCAWVMNTGLASQPSLSDIVVH